MMTVRAANLCSKDDLNTLRLIRNRCRKYMTRHTDHISLAEQFEWGSTFKGKVYIVEEGYPIGYGVIQNNLVTGAILPPFRGKGKGRELFKFLISQCVGEVGLEVLETNKRAYNLYKSLGFVEKKREKGVITMNLSSPVPLFKVRVDVDKSLPLIKEVLESGWIGEGPKSYQLEKEFGERVNNPYCVAVNSCTAALTIAFRLAGVQAGLPVISTPVTCSAGNVPLLTMGAQVKWADIDPNTGLIDLDSVEALLKYYGPCPIYAVHWGGNPLPLNDLVKLANKYGSYVIADCAQALDTYCGIKHCATPRENLFSCFSFQAIKHLTSADGGMLACPNKEMMDEAVLMRWYGLDRKVSREEQDILVPGYKFHMNDYTAALALGNLDLGFEMVEESRRCALYYNTSLPSWITPVTNLNGISSYWTYTVLCDDYRKVEEKLIPQKIMCGQVHVRNDKMHAFLPFQKDLPGVDEFYKRMVCIPCGWWVSEEIQNNIIKELQ